MTWKRLQAEGRVEPHRASKQELDDLRRAIERNLQDSSLRRLSADNKFGLDYEAALLLAKMVIACAGYRVKGQGAHHATFAALELALGQGASKAVSYFDQCRRKRNHLSYDAAGSVTATEAAELLRETRRFRTAVEAWISQNYPQFS